ncbi:MAG: hypothetical protein EXR98_03635 [Gemmataceae bacterium]|nr:hypothetical protein [Gemmataceae bacterium]
MFSRLTIGFLCWLGLVPFAAAQPTPCRYELLSLLPDDFAVCVVMHDLRGHSARWEQADWLKAFKQSPVGKALLASPEMEQLERMQTEMKKHLGLDWPTLRDDILGDTLVLSYSPGPKNKPDDERGLFLLHVREPKRLTELIGKFNDVQEKAGELKLARVEFKGSTYYRRTHGRKTQFYFVKDSLAAITTKEEILQEVIQRLPTQSKDNAWAKRFQRAGAASAFVTMCVNPAAVEPDLVQAGKKDGTLPAYWRALEAIFVTLAIRDEAELRISIQADPQKLPVWARSAFTDTIPTSSLWQRFPEKSILTIAGSADFAGTAEALKLLMPEKDRKKLASDWQAGIGAVLPLDPFKDILPNLGPDWGVCILPSKDAKNLPQAMFALAVKSGPKEQPIDKGLFKGAQFFGGLLILEHNRTNPNATIRLQTLMQDKVEVVYFSSDAIFPAGFQPACALKDGFLLFATSPAAIADFRVGTKPAAEAPLLRLSTRELARLLEHRRGHIIATLTERQQMSENAANKNVDDVIGALGLFERLTLSHHGGVGQASWSFRLAPSK